MVIWECTVVFESDGEDLCISRREFHITKNIQAAVTSQSLYLSCPGGTATTWILLEIIAYLFYNVQLDNGRGSSLTETARGCFAHGG